MTLTRVLVVLFASISCLASLVISASAKERGPSVVAAHAIVVDAATGDILYEKGADEHVKPASLTKLFIAAIASEGADLHSAMTAQDADMIGEASMGLHPGETLSLNALLHGMLMVSGNDAAMVVARETGSLGQGSAWHDRQRFLDRVNARLAVLGITNTHLVNPHGLDDPNQYSTARDIAGIGLYILSTSPELLTIMETPAWSGEGHNLTNTNALLGSYPGIIGGKTGFTTGAGYCLLEIAQRGGRTVVAVILDSSETAWYADATALLDFGFTVPVVPGWEPQLGKIDLSTLTAMTSDTGAAAANADAVGSGSKSFAPTNSQSMGKKGPASWRTAVVAMVGLAVGSIAIVICSRVPYRRRNPAGATFSTSSTHRQPLALTMSITPSIRPPADFWISTGSEVTFDWTAPLPIVAPTARSVPARRPPAGLRLRSVAAPANRRRQPSRTTTIQRLASYQFD